MILTVVDLGLALNIVGSTRAGIYVSRAVAELLESLRIGEFTGSRPRHADSDVAVESENGTVVRGRDRHNDVITPYDTRESLPAAADYLTAETTFDQLDTIAFARSGDDARARRRGAHAGVRGSSSPRFCTY